MKRLEEMLLEPVLGQRAAANCEVGDLQVEGDSIVLHYEDSAGVACHVDVTKRIWGPTLDIYETYVSTAMLRAGYILVPIEGGHIVRGGTEDYQVSGNTCTCPHFLYGLRKNDRCQHLIFRDWHIKYRGRVNTVRAELQG